MSDNTRIEWADSTWNPVTGCTRVSPGCENCYIEHTPPFRIEGRRFLNVVGERSRELGASTDIRLHHDRLDQPLRWRKPRRVFVNSLSDLFHEQVPDVFIARVFATMALAGRHTFLVLTKRHGRMRSLLSSGEFRQAVDEAWMEQPGPEGYGDMGYPSEVWPLSNVWLGVTVENQKWADVRIPALLHTPAAVRFLSCEPLLGRVDLSDHVDHLGEDDLGECDWGFCSRAAVAVRRDWMTDGPGYATMLAVCERHRGIDWVICGGESGPNARPMHPDWARALRDQCTTAGVPYFFKQWGEWAPDEWVDEEGDRHVGRKPEAKDPRSLVMHPAGMTALTPDNPFDPWDRGHPNWHTVMRRVGKKAAGRELDGRTWDEYPGGEQ